VGAYWVKITVSDGHDGTDTHNFTLKVENVNDAPEISTVPATEATEDAEYRVELAATDMDAGDVLTWSLNTTAGWLSLDPATGVLNGTPSNRDVGSAWVKVSVKDAAGATDSLGFMLTVINVNDPPVWLTVAADRTMTEKEELLVDVLATDVDVGDSIRYGVTSEPASGISINPVSGTLRWTSVQAGNYTVNVTATDGKATVRHSFNLTVNRAPVPVQPPANRPPVLATVAARDARVGEALSLRLNGSDPDTWDAVNLTFRLVTGPAGMIVSADGSLLWIPTKDQVGTHTVKVTLTDGQSHEVDSSDMAFQAAAQGAFWQAYAKAKPQILEPIMKLSVESPVEFVGNIFGSINQRRGLIVSTVEDGIFARVDAEVPLSEMFGYSTILRSMTQGKAEFTMEFLKYARVPVQIAEKLTAEHEGKTKKDQAK
jgi:hypothetical protein